MWGWGGGMCGSGGRGMWAWHVGVAGASRLEEVGGDENGDDGSGVEGGRRLGLVDVFHQPLEDVHLARRQGGGSRVTWREEGG